MARNGNVNFQNLKNFGQKLEGKLGGGQLDLFLEDCAKELAARLLAKVIKRTPVGEYDKPVSFTTKSGKQVSFTPHTGKLGGTLRRGWTNGRNQGAHGYANSLLVHHFGDVYVIEIINPVEYASYVEFGHRTRGGSGWVEGKFMLTISEQEIQADAPRILSNKIKKKLEECFR